MNVSQKLIVSIGHLCVWTPTTFAFIYCCFVHVPQSPHCQISCSGTDMSGINSGSIQSLSQLSSSLGTTGYAVCESIIPGKLNKNTAEIVFQVELAKTGMFRYLYNCCLAFDLYMSRFLTLQSKCTVYYHFSWIENASVSSLCSTKPQFILIVPEFFSRAPTCTILAI